MAKFESTSVANVVLVPNPEYVTTLLGNPESVAWRLGERPAVAEKAYRGDTEHHPMGEDFPDWMPNKGDIHRGIHQRALILVWDAVAIEQSWYRVWNVEGVDPSTNVLSNADIAFLGKIVFMDAQYRVLEAKGP